MSLFGLRGPLLLFRIRLNLDEDRLLSEKENSRDNEKHKAVVTFEGYDGVEEVEEEDDEEEEKDEEDDGEEDQEEEEEELEEEEEEQEAVVETESSYDPVFFGLTSSSETAAAPPTTSDFDLPEDKNSLKAKLKKYILEAIKEEDLGKLHQLVDICDAKGFDKVSSDRQRIR